MEDKVFNENEIKPVKVRTWHKKTSKQKVYFIISMVILALAIAFLFTLAFAREVYGNEFADILYGSPDIPNGFVVIGNTLKDSSIKIALSLFIIFGTFILVFIVNFIIKLITSGSKKAQTTGSIIRSLVKYIAVIVSVAWILVLWGVDVFGVVASVGVLTLVIGLGCQSLINDIVSGLFIVFDDYFSVGDMVIIDGFRGYVTEIGLRSIKLDDNCGNIKSINNSNISSCVNLSRQPNYISITMDASYFEDVERLEGVFARELPKIKEKMPQIVDGPWYKGIDNFNGAGVSYTFAFLVKAEYRFQATRDFKREIYQMFVNNDIIVPFNQVTINQADPKDRPKASDEDKAESSKVLATNRAKKVKEKQKISQKIKKAYKESLEDIKN